MFCKSLEKLPQLKNLSCFLSGVTDFKCLGKQYITQAEVLEYSLEDLVPTF